MLSRLDWPELVAAGAACRRLRHACRPGSPLWESVCQRRWAGSLNVSLFSDASARCGPVNWRAAFESGRGWEGAKALAVDQCFHTPELRGALLPVWATGQHLLAADVVVATGGNAWVAATAGRAAGGPQGAGSNTLWLFQLDAATLGTEGLRPMAAGGRWRGGNGDWCHTAITALDCEEAWLAAGTRQGRIELHHLLERGQWGAGGKAVPWEEGLLAEVSTPEPRLVLCAVLRRAVLCCASLVRAPLCSARTAWVENRRLHVSRE